MQSLTRFFHILGFALLWCLAVAPSFSRAADNTAIPAIAAASDLRFALDDISQKFTNETGLKVKISYGSSGNFATQIQNGAPYELFLSADEKYIQQLHSAGVARDAGVLYAQGQLAIVVPKTGCLSVDPELKGLAEALAAGKITRFAIANPDHAPYGEKAKEALQFVQLWDVIQPKLILGENVSQAGQFAISGSTQGGIIALSLAMSPTFAKHSDYAIVPAKMHSPLFQRMALMTKAGETAQHFYDYLRADSARRVLADYGFSLPEQP
ncbi:molybdenum ABC transporter substrate-binding protein [Shewanella sp. Pdp11]|uniref:molybdate ABC transporter substrate-binding protein n=1 Tax=Shewanella sp. Pdp11 TaxID=2059264 RepID=UPI000CA19EF2|nr:molybdate ABC transporter substrate-binding protein [Shewanella sp. Pdp11]AUD58196.1 molybdenum ABC transporter substrate-binding protein [Shewanella sp. Pdp11]